MIRFINCFEVPVGRDEEFLEFWGAGNRYMAAKPGYVGHRLHRAVTDDARYRFVNYVEWDSPRAWADAHDQGFHVLASRIAGLPFTSTNALYEVVHSAGTISDHGEAAAEGGQSES